MTEFPATLRRLRLRAAMAQVDLAAAIGVHWNMVQRWENGTFLPRLATIPTLCRVLKCSADELLGIKCQ